jgi:uncharacterized protein (DUF427 family)
MPAQLTPGPDHPIELTAAPGRMIATFDGHAIATSDKVLMLREADYPAVAYFPREDVEMAYMGRTQKTTHCPYKGDASYYTLTMDGHVADNAVWTYETPYPAMDAIKDRLAFYPNVVDVTVSGERAGKTPAEAAEVDEIVRHTDSGGALDSDGRGPRLNRPRDDRAEHGDPRGRAKAVFRQP